MPSICHGGGLLAGRRQAMPVLLAFAESARGVRLQWQLDGPRRICMKTCTHLDQVRDVKPLTPNGCEECLKMGDTWVHLRLCLECGHVGCCDSSKNKHATKHFHRTKH